MALRAAMAAVGARFWGAVPEIYVQDEGFERFNTKRHDIARELISSLAERFTRFVYITHVDSLGDSADVRLRVEGENGRSVIAA
jgi:DNA repair exonuclease SbcCD ATPase subunit